MSAKLWAEVWELDLDHATSRVLMCLCNFAHDVPGERFLGIKCYPAISIIVWYTGYDSRRVQRIMKYLRGTGIIFAKCFRLGKSPVEYEIHLENAKRKPAYTGPETRIRLRLATPGTSTTPTPGTSTTPTPGTSTTPRYRDRPPVPVPSVPRYQCHPSPGTGTALSLSDPLKEPLSHATTSSFPSVGDGSDDDGEHCYVEKVLEIFGQLPGTTVKTGDRKIAQQFFKGNVPIEQIETALWMGAARRLKQQHTTANGGPIEPIVSLSYFMAIVNEVVESPPPATYTKYLKSKVQEYSQ